MKAIHHLRVKARSTYLLKTWEKDTTLSGIRPTKTQPMTLETGETVELYNPNQTVIDNPTKQDVIKAFHKNENKKDPTHSGNLKRANEARNQLDPNLADSIQCG